MSNEIIKRKSNKLEQNYVQRQVQLSPHTISPGQDGYQDKNSHVPTPKSQENDLIPLHITPGEGKDSEVQSHINQEEKEVKDEQQRRQVLPKHAFNDSCSTRQIENPQHHGGAS